MPTKIWRRLSFVLLVLMLLLAGKSSAYDETTAPPADTMGTTSATTNLATAVVDGGKSTSTTTESPYKAYGGDSEQVDVIDVANHANPGQNMLTGETTRYFTTGEVDDSFWLKHLGADFKHAVHLLVGGNEQYAQVYNSTKPGSYLHEIQHEYVRDEPQRYRYQQLQQRHQYQQKQQAERQSEQDLLQIPQPEPRQTHYANEQSEQTNNYTANPSNIEEHNAAQDNTKQNYNDQAMTNKNDEEPNKKNGIYEQKSYETVFKIDDDEGITSNTYHVPNEYETTKTKYTKHKYSNVPKTVTTYSHEKKNNEKKADQEQNYDSVVVNLPESNGSYEEQTNKEQAPIVVKMPPVIYHSYPTYVQEEEASSRQEQAEEPQTQAQTQQQHQYTPLHQTQTQQHTYNTQKHTNLDTQNTHQTSSTQHQHPVRQYSTTSQQTDEDALAHQQQQHNHHQHHASTANLWRQGFNQYEGANYYNPPPFELSTFPNSQHLYGGAAATRPTTIDSVGSQESIGNYYLNRPEHITPSNVRSSFGSLASHLPFKSSFNGYARATRACRDLFYLDL